MTKRVTIGIFLLVITIVLYLLSRPPASVERSNEAAKIVAQPPKSGANVLVAPSGGAERPVEVSPQKPLQSVRPEASVPPHLSAHPQSGMPAASRVSQPIEEITSPSDELDNVQLMVRGYRDVLGENPFGNNLEITKALMGQNAKQVKMPLPVGSHLNESGELSDRWGTPYFFHQLSGKQMEVRSAGPDQQMWTNDDLVTR